jgi:N-acetylneuraminic acid mutarotase
MKKFHFYLASMIILLLVSSCSKNNNGGGGGGGNPVWTMLAPMPTARHHFGFVENNGLFYAIGGYNANGLNTVEVYDPSANSWQTKAPMPTARGYLVVAAVAGKIYAIGGLTGADLNNVTYTGATEEYDPASNTWTQKAPFPICAAVNSVLGNQFITGTAINGKIYVAAGSAGTDQPMFIYDPVTDLWQTDSVKGVGKFNLQPYFSTASFGDMYVSDGDYFLKYSSASGSWNVLQPYMTTRLGACIVADGSDVYYMGGFAKGDSVSVTDDVELFPSSGTTWVKKPSLNVKRHSASALMFGGNIYVAGGADQLPNHQDVPIASMEVLQVKLKM